MEFTGERAVEGQTPQRIWLDHLERYKFAALFVNKKRVLDIACGSGYGSKILYDAGAKEVIGIDLSEEAINYATLAYKENGLKFERGEIEDIAYRSSYFDAIVCFETIEHIKNQNKGLLELKRVLKPNGLLIISSPNRRVTSPGGLMNELPRNPFHTLEYSADEFVVLLKNYFKVLRGYGQRGISKVFYFGFLRMILTTFLPNIYSPVRGSSKPKSISHFQEYRYLILVCKK